jgi:CheY-like chemotaxis protein
VKILIAEDDLVARRVLESVLLELGHEIDAHDDGRAAWDAYRRDRHPIVITDWMMPDLDGLQLCRRIRTTPSTSYTYVIVLTGKVGREHYQQAIAAGVDDFLTKPLDRDLLEARLTVAQRIVGIHHHTRRLESLLHVCAWCKQIRDRGSWVTLESYLQTQTGSPLTHGICPSCTAKWKADPDWKGELGR